MNLRTQLYQYCEQHNLKDLACIIHFALVNYISTHKSPYKWVYLSPEILNSFIGIGEEEIINLLEYLSKNSDAIKKNYEIYCPKDEEYFCEALEEEDLEDEEYEIFCDNCEINHLPNEITKKIINYKGNKEKILEQLKIANQDIAKEMIIFNTNEDHIEKLANIIISRLNVNKDNKEEAKKGIIKILSSIKEVSGLVASISEDAATTSGSIRKIIEDWTGFSSLKNLLGF